MVCSFFSTLRLSGRRWLPWKPTNLSSTSYPAIPLNIVQMARSRTLKAVASSRQRKGPRTKAAPLTAAQKKQKQQAREEASIALKADVDEWMQYTNAKIHELAEKYNKKPRYFQNIFFQGGANLVHERSTTAWNAFASKKANEVNGGKPSLPHFMNTA
jgi:hypothetical protein